MIVHETQCVRPEDCLFSFECASLVTGSCVLGEPTNGDLVFYNLDPLEGKKNELARVNLVGRESRDPWVLSHRGDKVALALTHNSLLIVNLLNGSTNQVEVETPYLVRFPSWAASGNSLVFSGVSTNENSLTRLELDGTTRVIWRNPAAWVTRILSSPDGQHLMAHGWSLRSDVWMLCSDSPSGLQ